MNKLFLLLKGFLIGVANIIPGVSGGTLAITLGIYEKLIDIVVHPFKNLKENIKFLIPIGLGAVFAILLLSNIINYCLDNYNMATTFFFVGLILGGVPVIFNKIKSHIKSPSNVSIFLLTFILVILFSVLNAGNNTVSFTNMNLISYLLLFLVGVIAAATMVIPGISGSFVLMLLGYYNSIIETISDLSKFQNIISNMLILIPFGIGVIVGIVLISKIIEYLLKRFNIKTYFAIFGFVLSSMVGIIIKISDFSFSFSSILLSLVTLVIGTLITTKLGEMK
ncbi:MAG: DUF368 domain-containing protein [Bacilli bacterium]